MENEYAWVRGFVHAFKYDIHNFGPTCAPFNISGSYKKELEQGAFEVEEKSALYTVYHSQTKVDPYLIVLTVDPFTFVFYIHEEESLAHWKQKYSYLTRPGLLKAFLPEKPAEIKHITFTMDTKRAFFS